MRTKIIATLVVALMAFVAPAALAYSDGNPPLESDTWSCDDPKWVDASFCSGNSEQGSADYDLQVIVTDECGITVTVYNYTDTEKFFDLIEVNELSPEGAVLTNFSVAPASSTVIPSTQLPPLEVATTYQLIFTDEVVDTVILDPAVECGDDTDGNGITAEGAATCYTVTGTIDNPSNEATSASIVIEYWESEYYELDMVDLPANSTVPFGPFSLWPGEALKVLDVEGNVLAEIDPDLSTCVFDANVEQDKFCDTETGITTTVFRYVNGVNSTGPIEFFLNIDDTNVDELFMWSDYYTVWPGEIDEFNSFELNPDQFVVVTSGYYDANFNEVVVFDTQRVEAVDCTKTVEPTDEPTDPEPSEEPTKEPRVLGNVIEREPVTRTDYVVEDSQSMTMTGLVLGLLALIGAAGTTGLIGARMRR